jgi:hypothetical protein
VYEKFNAVGLGQAFFLSFSALCRRHCVDGKMVLACSPYPCSVLTFQLICFTSVYTDHVGRGRLYVLFLNKLVFVYIDICFEEMNH